MRSHFIASLFLVNTLLCVLALSAAPVAVVDHHLVSQENWVKPWAADWDSAKVVAVFKQNGVDAEVIGLATLKDPAALGKYRALMIPTDECYPDEGTADGPVSKSIRSYVKGGGIYIMPMGAAHCRWKDAATGAVTDAPQWAPRDFLGVEWKVLGNHQEPGPDLCLTDEGNAAGVPRPELSHLSTYVRAATPTGTVYVANADREPCLTANAIGKGAVIHYAGGVPLGPPVRDWLLAAYSAILKSGPGLRAIRSATMASESVYQLVPVSPRESGQITLDGEWELAEAKDEWTREPSSPGPGEWLRVQMPNTIQHALFEAGKTKNPWFGDNYKDLQWIAKTDWWLRKRLTIPDDWQQRHIRLEFDGMDYLGAVWLDGAFLGSHEGMFGGPSFDLTRMLKPGEHELLVRLIHESGPQSGPTRVMKSMAVDGTSYQWGNRYRTIGLWRSVRLVSTGGTYLEAPYVRTDRIGPGMAALYAEAMIQNSGEASQGTISARIIDLQSGKVVWQGKTQQAVPAGRSYWEQTMEIEKPKLWWPNGVMEGTHPFYRLQLSLSCHDRQNDLIATRFGIRTVEMVRNPSWPASPRSNLHTTAVGEAGSFLWDAMRNPDESYRFLFVVNGVPMYGKGGCWLTSDDLLVLNPDRESWMIRAAKAAGLNLFRLNGGCNIIETEQFYNLCDENGILVWQEIPFCWNTTYGSSLNAWREQLTRSVLRLRQHPSLAVYVGGNEFNPYDPGVSPVVDLFREICAGYDNRPFRMSSPGGGTAHAYVPWKIYGADPSWYGTIYDEGYNFVSEWSFVTVASPSLLDRIIPPDEMAKKPIGSDWRDFVRDHPLVTDRSCELDFAGHYPFNRGSWYSDFARADLREFAEDAQMAQADVYGCVFEQWRSQFPYKGGETVWVYNTIGPSSSWNLIDWFGQPMISYYSTKRSDEPIHVMAKTPFRSFGPGERFRAAVVTLTDLKKPQKGAITARLLDRGLEPLLTKHWEVSIGAEKTNPQEITWDIPSDTPESYFFLELTLDGLKGKRLSRQVYWERVLKSLADPAERRKWQAEPVPEPVCKAGPWLKPQMASCATSLSVEVSPLRAAGPEATVAATVKNTGKKPAYPVILSVSPEKCAVIWSDNYFWLDPGETAIITGVVRLDMRGLDPMSAENKVDAKNVHVNVTAWNAKGRGGSEPASATPRAMRTAVTTGAAR